ncbi:MAG: topoisomerase I, partial [Euryarchaeota archaeon]|nr:topoisomerase I [Euryarchaeota archaeon]
TKLGLSASRAMRVAEDLYTAGYISYPRTDNTVYPPSLGLKRILEKLKDSEFKDEAEELLSQERIRPSRGKTQTTDHPPIYPTEAATRKKLKGDKWKIYELVVRRFMATVAPPAKAELSDATLDVNGEEFKAKGYRMLYLGWKKYYPYFKINEFFLPTLVTGEEVVLKEVLSEKKMTQPPRRYTQGSLLQEMERLSLGTKSTRHDIIQKLYDRKYAEGNDLVPTPSGVAVAESLNRHAQIVTDSKMTAQLEKDMDEIANGQASLQEVVTESQEMLSNILDTLEANREQIGTEIRKALESQHFIGKCPDCDSDLKTIRTRFGKTFIGCSGYPDCKRTYPMPGGAKVETTDEVCATCKAPMVRVIRRGQPVIVHCLDPDCESNQERTKIGICPQCSNDLRVVYSRAGKRFIGCAGYPDCTQTYPLPQYGRFSADGETCPECGAPILLISMRGRAWQSCVNLDCPTRKKSKKKTTKKKTAKKKTTKKTASKAKKTAAASESPAKTDADKSQQ